MRQLIADTAALLACLLFIAMVVTLTGFLG
jgi:hypothetical protein